MDKLALVINVFLSDTKEYFSVCTLISDNFKYLFRSCETWWVKHHLILPQLQFGSVKKNAVYILIDHLCSEVFVFALRSTIDSALRSHARHSDHEDSLILNGLYIVQCSPHTLKTYLALLCRVILCACVVHLIRLHILSLQSYLYLADFFSSYPLFACVQCAHAHLCALSMINASRKIFQG